MASSRSHDPSRQLIALACLALAGSMMAPALTQRGAPAAQFEYSVKAPLASRSLFLDGVSVDGLLVAVGERGHILISRDQGQSWRQANVPTQATLTGVYFHDKDLGWVVGHDAIILRTADGGENWERLYHAPEQARPLLDVWFRDAEHGMAVGAYGLFLITTNGGETWSSCEVGRQGVVAGNHDDVGEESDFHLNHIARSQNGRLYMAAEAGTFYRSDDDGETWNSLPSPYLGSLFGTLPLDNDALLLFGLRGHMFRSENAGLTWQAVDTATEAMLTDGLRLDDGTILVTGLDGTLLTSQDDGRSFTLRQQADRQAIAAAVQSDDGTVIIVGEFGVTQVSRSEYGVAEGF